MCIQVLPFKDQELVGLVVSFNELVCLRVTRLQTLKVLFIHWLGRQGWQQQVSFPK